MMIEQYDIDYCSQSDSLKEFRLLICPTDTFNAIEKPFKRVESFDFEDNLPQKISQLNQWLPKFLRSRLI